MPKALGTGIGEVAWKEIEILGDEQNAPILKLYGTAEQKARELGLSTWSVSISHGQSLAVAFVVALGLNTFSRKPVVAGGNSLVRSV